MILTTAIVKSPTPADRFLAFVASEYPYIRDLDEDLHRACIPSLDESLFYFLCAGLVKEELIQIFDIGDEQGIVMLTDAGLCAARSVVIA